MKNKSYMVRRIFIFLVGFLILYALAFIIPSNTTVFACGTDIDCGSGQECTGASCDPETQLCSGGSCTNVGETQPNQQECFHCSSVSGGFCERTQIPVTEPCGSDCAGCPGGSQPGGSPPPSPPPLPTASNPNSVCSYDNKQRVTLSWDQITGASAYILRVDSYAPNSPSWVDYTDFIVGTSSNSICSGGRCSFLSGTLGNMWNSYCPITGRTCNNEDFTNGPTDIYPNAGYGWSVQGIAPGESYPFAGGRAEGGFTCGCTVTGARCGTITSNSVTIENISWTDSGWGANGMFIDNTGNPAGPFPGYFIPFFASTYTVTGLTPGTYTYNVACYKDFGGGSSMIGYSGPFTCTIPAAPTSPTITSLQVGNASPGQVVLPFTTGVTQTSGLVQSQNGSNWKNPMAITLNANANSGSISKSYVVFYNQTLGSAANLNDALTKVEQFGRKTNGFALAYGQNIKAGDPPGNHYYVYSVDLGDWVNIDPGFPTYYEDAGYPIGSYYYAYPKTDGTSPAAWKIQMQAAFGGKNMYTAASVENDSGAPAVFASDCRTSGTSACPLQTP